MRDMFERANRLECDAERAMNALRATLVVKNERFTAFNAGSTNGEPHFGFFPRDLFTAGLMIRSPSLLRESIRFAVHTIGKACNPVTGEEPGRVLHESNQVERDGLLSHYNACETSQLLLISARELLQVGTEEDVALLQGLASGLAAAGRYVLSHIWDDLFVEDPQRCGAERYFAHATYWKDSHLPGRRAIEYPVVYTLVQAQTVSALRSLAVLTSRFALGWKETELLEIAQGLNDRIWRSLWDQNLDVPLIAQDRGMSISGISSDALHMLAYLEPADVPARCLEAIQTASARLKTQYGYRSYAPNQAEYAPDAYHLGSIWPYEQAFIAKGARRFGMDRVFRGATLILRALEELGFPELVVWNGQSLSGSGCDVQLWTCVVPHAFEILLQGYPEGRDPTKQSADRNRES